MTETTRYGRNAEKKKGPRIRYGHAWQVLRLPQSINTDPTRMPLGVGSFTSHFVYLNPKPSFPVLVHGIPYDLCVSPPLPAPAFRLLLSV